MRPKVEAMVVTRLSATLAIALLVACLSGSSLAFQLTPSLVGSSGATSVFQCSSRPRSAIVRHSAVSMSSTGDSGVQGTNFPKLLASNTITLAMASMIALLPSGAVADDLMLNSPNINFMSLAAVDLPDGWASSTTPEGREYYYNTQTRQSQWEPPQGATQGKSKDVKRKKSGDLREVVGFEAPVIPVDKVTKKDAPKLAEGCGEGEFRANSIECAAPKQAKEGVDKATAADERYRMLQAAETKSLEKTKLFKDLQAKTNDPERAKARAKEVERITAENDIGSVKAPWTSDRDRPPPARLELPKLELPKLQLPKLPF